MTYDPTKRLPWYFHHDPAEESERWRQRYLDAVLFFQHGRDSVDVFRAKLKTLGFAPSQIVAEINLARP
jgi:hypothetical protein